MANTTISTTSLKIFCRDECRRLRATGAPPTLAQLKTAIINTFALETQPFQLHWKDADDDMVTIVSSEDIVEAIAGHDGATLKLFLTIESGDLTTEWVEVNVSQAHDTYAQLLSEIVKSKQLKPTPTSPRTKFHGSAMQNQRGDLLSQIRRSTAQPKCLRPIDSDSHPHPHPRQPQATTQRTILVNQIKQGIVLKPTGKAQVANLSCCSPAIQRKIRIKQTGTQRTGLCNQIKQGVVLKPTPHQRAPSSVSNVCTSKAHKAVLNSIKQYHLLNTTTESCCASRFSREMQLLKEMGFGNIDTNWLQHTLESSSGDVNTIVALIVDNALRLKDITSHSTVLKEIRSHGGYCATNSTNTTNSAITVASKASCQPSQAQVQRTLFRLCAIELVAYVSMKHRVDAIASKAHVDIQDAISLYKRAICN